VRSACGAGRREPAPSGQLAIVVNAAAGGDSDDLGAVLGADLLEAVIVPVDDSGLDAAFARAGSASVLGIAGGDGSINAAAERALATNRPLAVFPGGTLNHFARDLGVGDVADAVDAVRNGELTQVDVGLIDGKPFLNTASFGSYAEFVDAREKREGRLGKWAAAIIAAVIVLWRAQPMRVELDGVRRSIWMIFIGNCEYRPPNLAPLTRDRLDDGHFDLRFVDGSRPFSRVRLLAALATGRLSRSRVYERRLVDAIEIRSLDGPLRLARDGETFDGGSYIRVTKHGERLAVFAPRAQP
jgi:diacylglycerol kinase family enzyme